MGTKKNIEKKTQKTKSEGEERESLQGGEEKSGNIPERGLSR